MDIPYIGRLIGVILSVVLFTPLSAAKPATQPADVADVAPHTQSVTAETVGETADVDAIAAGLRSEAGLPIGEVSVAKADNERGVAIFLPQTHLRPGTDPLDPVNDTALAVQREHRDIIARAATAYGARTVVVEGALTTEPLNAKTKNLRAAQMQAAALGTQAKAFAGQLDDAGESALANNVRESAGAFVGDIERSVLLKGAPYAVAAEHPGSVRLAGAENPKTKKESGEILRRYFYQKDRLAQLQRSPEGGSKIAGALPAGMNIAQAIRQRLLETFGGSLDNLAALTLPAQSAGEPQLTAVLQEARMAASAKGDAALANTAGTLIEHGRAIAALLRPPASANGAPSRADNPYSAVTDSAQLQEMMQQTEQDIQATIIDRRNREAADAFVAALQANGAHLGVIQFGLGHTDELVQELQDRGVSVITVRSTTVAERFAKDFDPMAK